MLDQGGFNQYPNVKKTKEEEVSGPLGLEEAYELYYDKIVAIASSRLAMEHIGHVFSPDDLVAESFLLMKRREEVIFNDSTHFLAMCAVVMRRILLDYARKERSQRRGGDIVKLPLDDPHSIPSNIEAPHILSLHEGLRKLHSLDPRAAQVIELRFFEGFTLKEIADSLGISKMTVRRDQQYGIAWLADFQKM